jgi:hypothetical protein
MKLSIYFHWQAADKRIRNHRYLLLRNAASPHRTTTYLPRRVNWLTIGISITIVPALIAAILTRIHIGPT